MLQLLAFVISITVGGIKAAEDRHNRPENRVAREERVMDADAAKSFERMIRVSEKLDDGEK